MPRKDKSRTETPEEIRKIQNSHLNPIKSVDDPRYAKFAAGRDKVNKRRKETRERHRDYRYNIASFKSQQLKATQEQIDAGIIPNPADMLISMITEQQLIVSGAELTKREHLNERQLLLSLYKEYAALTGANAPSSQTIDMNAQEAEVKTPADIREELILLTNDLRGS